MPTRPQRLKLSQRLAKQRVALAAAEGGLLAACARAAQDPDPQAAATEIEALRADRDAQRKALIATRNACLDDGADGTGIDLLSSHAPLALLPLRLETRYVGKQLWLRIYPDDIHVDAYEAALSPSEREAYDWYWKSLAGLRDTRPHAELWGALVARVGLRRALHIATLEDPNRAGQRPPGWSSPARAACLPDRFVAHLWLRRPERLALQPPDLSVVAPSPVREPLHLGPDPFAATAAAGPLDEQMLWLTDFKEALAAGMAMKIDLPSSSDEVERLIVTGVRASADPVGSAAALGALLGAHERTGGLDLCPPGTATNALPGTKTIYSSRTDPDALFRDQIAGALGPYRRHPPNSRSGTRPDPRSASHRVAKALGIPAATLGYTASGGQKSDRDSEVAVRELLRRLVEPAAMLALAGAADSADIAAIFDAFVAVEPGDPLPPLLVGCQPYGLLPVALPDPRAKDALTRMAARLRENVFAPALDRVACVTESRDPVDDLLTILSSAARPQALLLRAVLAGTAGRELYDRNPIAARRAMDSARASAEALLAALGATVTAPVLDWVMTQGAPASSLPLTGGQVPEEQALGLLHTGLDMASILHEAYPGGVRPDSFLFQMARAALLAAAIEDVFAAWRESADPAMRRLASDLAADPARFEPGGQGWQLVEAELFASIKEFHLTSPGPVIAGDWLPYASAGNTQVVHDLLGRLRRADPDALDMALGNGLEMLSHRLDAWLTAASSKQLAELRNAPNLPRGADGYAEGLNLGAFGFVERIPRRRGGSASAGHVLAPSLDHAAAAGVLLSADFADWHARRGSSFATDLSSARVARARNLIEGLSAGQPLGALLGYGIERALGEAGGTAPRLIAHLRELAPPVAHRLTQGSEPAAAVAAGNVADGWTLLRLATPPGGVAPDPALLGLATALTRAEQTALATALGTAGDALDALGDLLLAEGVFQLVRGSPARANAATAVLAGAGHGIDAVEIAGMPVRGDSLGHRVLALFGAPIPASGWDATARAKADPGAEGWAQAVLPAPDRIWLRFVAKDGTPHELTLAALLASGRADGLAELGLAAIDVILAADIPGLEAGAPLLRRLTIACQAHRQSSGELDLARPAVWEGDRVGIAELIGLAAMHRPVLCANRPLEPQDLPVASTFATADALARHAATLTALGAAKTLADAATGQDDATIERALLGAELVGIRALTSGDRAAALAAVKAELARRIALGANPPDPAIARWRDRMKALLGSGLPAAPGLDADHASLAAATARPLGANSELLREFVATRGKVRERLADLDLALCGAELLGGPGTFAIALAQTPEHPGAAWVGLPGTHAPASVGYVRVGAGPAALQWPSTRISGLFIDAWDEFLPARSLHGAAVFHADAPSQAAPNAVLLCPPPSAEGWRQSELVLLVSEALNLAQMRSVDPAALGTAGQLLPALTLRDRPLPANLLRRLAIPD